MAMPRYHAPCDPDCDDVAIFRSCLFNDPMTHAMGADTEEIMAGFEASHRRTCPRCQEYGAANIEIAD